MTARTRLQKRPPRQRGAVLFVSMVVLVALGIAAMALLRSTDVAALISGNLAFKRSTLNTSDLGVQAGYDYVKNSVPSDLQTPPNGCYSASQVDVDAGGIPNLLANTSTFTTAHPDCVQTAANGEKFYFYVERLCPQDNVAAYEDKCTAVRVVGSGIDTSKSPLTNVPPLYRTTIRVDGPRGTTSYSQVVWQRQIS